MAARAYAAAKADSPLAPIGIQRRAVGPRDVLIDVLYCGICHSDIHQARDEWSEWGPTDYPCVPGHEIIGRVGQSREAAGHAREYPAVARGAGGNRTDGVGGAND